MKTIQTTARFDDDKHLTLAAPVTNRPRGEVKVILQFEEPAPAEKKPPVDFRDAIGLAYRIFPDMPRRSTAEWMEELRGGERDQEA